MRHKRGAWLGAAIVVGAPAVTLMVLALNGSLATTTALDAWNSPAFAPYALSANRALRDLMLALTIGCLVLTASFPSSPAATAPTAAALARRRLMGIARVSGLAWVATANADLVFTFTEVAGVEVWSSSGLSQFGIFITELPLGRNLLAHAIGATLLFAGSLWVASDTGAFVLSIIALSALWPLGTIGHAAEDSGHLIAVYAQVAHMAGVSVWAGGLAAVVLLRHHLSQGDAISLVRRYSTLAGVGAILVGLSGLAAAWLRVGSWDGLDTAYGQLVLAKVVAFSLLLLAGYVHRRRLIPLLTDRSRARRAFGRLACGELATMSLAVGLAVALSRTPTP